ncbi:MAG: M1 family metallopeptidase [Calditrichia bacterium]|nr:M1 family metallopeptidase [Calditrichia bacterium]
MIKFIKWFGIIVATLILIIIVIIASILISHDRYGYYASGGSLSENQAAYDVLFYTLNLEPDFEAQAIAGDIIIKLKVVGDKISKIELDLINNFNVSEIIIGMDKLSFIHKDDKLIVKLNSTIEKDSIVELNIKYSGQPVEAIVPPWVGGFNWSKDEDGNEWIGVSCQGEGSKIWFPCKDHPSDKPDSAAINITVKEDYYCASNGILKSVTTPREGYKTFHWFTGYPISNYNININIGKYEIIQKNYITQNQDTMPMMFYVLPQSINGAEKHLDMAIDMLYTYRDYYGEYPFTLEKFAIVETDYLGMEHQTINAYGNKYKYDTLAGKPYDWLMLHEMGHEWWGNKVTAKDWADFWIHEGICTYGEALFQLSKAGEDAYHKYMKKIKGRVQNTKPIVPQKNATSHEVYSSDVYMKGASLMHTLRYVMGDELFFSTLKQFANDSSYTYKNLVTTSDFIELVNRNSGKDLSNLIDLYLHTTILPQILIDSVAQNKYHVSIHNIDFKLPMNVETSDSSYRTKLGPMPKEIYSQFTPEIDKKGWYLKTTIKTHSAKQAGD